MNVAVQLLIDRDQDTGAAEIIEVKEPALNAVLFDFNPSSHPAVTRIKGLHAALIQEMHDLQASPNATGFQKRAAAIAITELEGTQMRCVKALFAKG